LIPRRCICGELHSNSNPRTANRIEIATVGISHSEARLLKAVVQKSSVTVALGLDVGIEPIDVIYWEAYAAKTWGTLRLAEKGLHVELPTYGQSMPSAYQRYRPTTNALLPRLICELVGRKCGFSSP
jgi:hypothetical protein